MCEIRVDQRVDPLRRGSGRRVRVGYTGVTLRVVVHGDGIAAVTLAAGDTLLFGRSPHRALPTDPDVALSHHAVALPDCAPQVARLLGELAVSDEVVRLRWRATTEAELTSLLDAPGGARRIALTSGLTALLDPGDNHIVVPRGRLVAPDQPADLRITVGISMVTLDEPEPRHPDTRAGATAGAGAGAGPAVRGGPVLVPRSREWFVALALAEPWLTGTVSPRPPSNREIYERILRWHGDAWNLSRPQRVDDALRAVARAIFGPREDPFGARDPRQTPPGQARDPRVAIGRRAAEARLVTSEDIDRVERDARTR